MQVFNTYFKILKKNLISICIYAVLFLAIAAAITSNIKVENTKYKPSKVNAMIINEDGQSALIDGFMKYLGDYVNFIKPKENEDARREALFYREAVYILTIPKGFSDSYTKNGNIKLKKMVVPDSIEALSLDNTINNYFNVANVYRKQIPSIKEDKLNEYITKSLENTTQVNMDVKVKDSVTFSNGFNSNYFNYLGYIMIASYITVVSMIMFSFHGIDIRRRHTASPVSNRSMNLQLIFANLIFVCFYLLVFIVTGYFLNKDRIINANTILIWLNAFVFSFTVLSISYLIGITAKSKNTVAAISTGLSLGLAFISGLFVPQQYLGASVLRVASFTPSYWYAKANNTLLNVTSFKSPEIRDALAYMAIETGFTIAIICIALVISKRKRQQAI